MAVITIAPSSAQTPLWPPGLIAVAGGKITTYRRMAQRVLELVDPELGPAPGLPNRTATVPLPGADVGPAGLEAFHAERSQDLVEAGVAPEAVERLCWLYGRQLDDLLGLAVGDPSWLEPLAPGVPALRGEVFLAVEREMALTLIDFMDRRAALLLFSPNFGLAGAEAAADIMAESLEWDANRKATELAAYRELASEHGLPSE